MHVIDDIQLVGSGCGYGTKLQIDDLSCLHLLEVLLMDNLVSD